MFPPRRNRRGAPSESSPRSVIMFLPPWKCSKTSRTVDSWVMSPAHDGCFFVIRHSNSCEKNIWSIEIWSLHTGKPWTESPSKHRMVARPTKSTTIFACILVRYASGNFRLNLAWKFQSLERNQGHSRFMFWETCCVEQVQFDTLDTKNGALEEYKTSPI